MKPDRPLGRPTHFQSIDECRPQSMRRPMMAFTIR